MKTPNPSGLNHLRSLSPTGRAASARNEHHQRRHWLARAVCSGVVMGILGLGANRALAQVNLLHSFTGGTDGSQPLGTLALSGTNLYGMALSGGSKGCGTVFKVSTDGGSFSLLHTFTNGATGGCAPSGSLTLAGTAIYGLTSGGGSNGWGTVFRMDTNGAGYTNLHSFANVTTDGRSPYGSLALGGATLYGMTTYAGNYNNGVVFKLNTDGTGYTVLHHFAGGTTDGKQPFYGSLVLSGSTLYGMTQFGGTSDKGVIFKLNINGDNYGFGLLHSFAGGANDGNKPYDSLTLSNSTLYGMTYYGGSNDLGVVFCLSTNGTGYTNLHSFAGGGNDGSHPVRSLALSGSTLYGMTQYGGYGYGTAFKMNTDGSGFSLLHSFVNTQTDGSSPQGDLTVAGTVFYGTTYSGGYYNNGTVFSLSLTQTITATAGSHGTILPAGAVTVPSGSTTNFVITPDLYWHVADVTTNGVSVGAVTAFTWPNITADGSISATFAPDPAAGGTPHWWLATFGWTNNFDAAEASDTDGDGFTAGQEYIAGTDPTDSASALRIVDIKMAPPQLTVLSATNRLYTIYGRPELAIGNWVPVSNQTDIPGTGSLLTLSDTNAPAADWFYRLSVRLP